MFPLVVAYFFCAPSEYCYQGLPLFSFAFLVFPECLTNQIHQLNISFKDPNDDQSNPLDWASVHVLCTYQKDVLVTED